MKNIEDSKKKTIEEQSRGLQKTPKIKSLKGYGNRNKKKLLLRIGIILGILIIGGVGTTIIIQNQKYKSYKVIGKTEKLDGSSTQYIQMEKGIFRYSANGASLVGENKSLIWEKSYEMQNPLVDISEGTVAVYSQKGNQVYVFNTSGVIGEVKTEMPILKAKVSKNGVIGTILEDGDTTWINFYSVKGEILASAKTRVDNPGYPVDFSISDDGKLIMVSYLFVDGDTTTSHVAFYNLADEGKKVIDNMVSGYQYKGTVVPMVEYLNSDTSIAFRENGFSLYNGTGTPKETVKIVKDKEIVSTFYDDKHIGMVFVSGEKNKKYVMEIYNLKGRLIANQDFSIQYEQIKVSDGQVLMFNESQVSVFSMNGVEKFRGNFNEGTIKDIFRTGYKEYLVVQDNGISTIGLK